MRSALATLISTMVSPPLASIAIMSARRPLGSGTSQIENRSRRQNSRVTPRATSPAIGGASAKQAESSAASIFAELEQKANAANPKIGHVDRRNGRKRLAVEDVVADRSNALELPAG